MGCYFAPDTDADVREGGIEPPSDLFGGTVDANGGSDAGSGCSANSPLTAMRIRVRTTTAGGRYSPRNIGAIWIETEAGAFVKTVERWAGTRARWLTKFIASSSSNLVDAVTGATLSQHTTHDRMWNLQDVARCEIAPGNYRVMVEMTDKNGAGPSLAIPFTMNGSPVMLTPTEAANFHDLLIDLH